MPKTWNRLPRCPQIVGPIDGNGNSRRFRLDDKTYNAWSITEERIHVSPEEFRRLAKLCGIGLNEEDAEADRAENPDDYDDDGNPKA